MVTAVVTAVVPAYLNRGAEHCSLESRRDVIVVTHMIRMAKWQLS